jgi:hypothetical protein
MLEALTVAQLLNTTPFVANMLAHHTSKNVFGIALSNTLKRQTSVTNKRNEVHRSQGQIWHCL